MKEVQNMVCSKCNYEMSDACISCPRCGAVVVNEKTYGRGYAYLAYLGLAKFYIPMKMRSSSFAMYHFRQGLFLWLLTLPLSLFIEFSVEFSGWTMPIVILSVITFSFSSFMSISGIINVAKGKRQPLPLIGRWFEEKR